MRDLHLRHTLTMLARDASAVFADLVEAGQEIPFEIVEPGEALAFCQYRPMTAKFVRDNSTELRELESFAEAVESMRRSEIAATYLEEAGIAPPADSVERATLALTYFLARLWDGCSEFELDPERFASALAEVEECGEPEAGEVEAIVPLAGFRTPVDRIDLKGASIVRADLVEVPAEAARGERPAAGEWEPTFLISARVALDPDGGLAGAGERVAQAFAGVVTTLRLHRPGGVGLGPHGWVRIAGDRWRRIATGAARPRSGGYRLSEDEVPELVDLARTVAVHPKRLGRLRRAVLRFESGLERRGAIDALNDHLLALRFLLEGEGPAGVGLPMRVAALTEDSGERQDVRGLVEEAIGLERELWSGEPSQRASSPSDVAIGIERLLRGILCRAVSGELGSDLRAAADEMLLADGLAVGAGADSLGSTAEWDLESVEAEAQAEPRHEPALEQEGEPASASVPERDADFETAELDAAEAFERFERDAGGEIAASRPGEDQPEPDPQPDPEPEPAERSLDAPDWLQEVDEGRGATMDFPARSDHLRDLAKPPLDRDEVKARVEYLFPRTETDWTVGRGSPSPHARAS